MVPARIMVVEDEGLVALGIKEGLESLGYEVTAVASSADGAINQALSTEPDLVLMDIHLKGGSDGIEAARQLKQALNIPVVYLTAYSDQETLNRAILSEPLLAGKMVKRKNCLLIAGEKDGTYIDYTCAPFENKAGNRIGVIISLCLSNS